MGVACLCPLYLYERCGDEVKECAYGCGVGRFDLYVHLWVSKLKMRDANVV